jgi:DNA-binding SARP family transcriptional activator
MVGRHRSSSARNLQPNADDPVRLEVRVVGRFEIVQQGASLRSARNSARLVAYLALHPGKQRRVTVASHLWTDATEARASACLRTALWKARNDHPSLVDASGPTIQLADAVDVDLHRMVDAAQRLIASCTHSELGQLTPGDYTNDLLPDWDEDWLVLERERWRQLRIHALEAIAGNLIGASRFAEAIDVAHMAIAAEPLRESPHHLAIKAHLGERNQYEALRHYDRFVKHLNTELGVGPSSRLRALVESDRSS